LRGAKDPEAKEHTMNKTIVVTGASSGFGAMTVRALADAGHVVYAGIRDTNGRNQPALKDAAEYASTHNVELRPIELDVNDQSSVDTAIAKIIADNDRLDVIVHNAGHMVLGPVEAFTPEQITAIYDVNVLSTQRVNRAALPQLRAQLDGLLVWVGSSSSRGGTPPYLGPYFAAKAAEDALAVSYAAELARFGIDTTIIVPGSFTTGTNHFAHAGHPEDTAVAQAYEAHYAGLMDQVRAKLAEIAPLTPTRARWPAPSCGWWTRPRVSARSGFTSIQSTVLKRSTTLATTSAPGSASASAWQTCSARPAPTDLGQSQPDRRWVTCFAGRAVPRWSRQLVAFGREPRDLKMLPRGSRAIRSSWSSTARDSAGRITGCAARRSITVRSDASIRGCGPREKG
jgi:NAD(P)-dependent dehydrogenase (short-subunit alcohol dehydrogenase family)